jgi:hypothetical protein
MRLRCPKCNHAFKAKSNARTLKCPECGHRDQAPPEGFESMPGWRKGKVGSFDRLDSEGQATRPAGAGTSRGMMVGIALVAIAILAIAGWAIFMRGGPAGGGASGQPAMDFITPGNWTVSSDSEQIMAWIHNTASSSLDYTWSLTGPGGTPLPPGWSASFSPPSGTAAAAASGTKDQGGQQTFPDWQKTMVSLTIPPTQAAADVPIELHAASGMKAGIVHVVAARGPVVQSGQAVHTTYSLHRADGSLVSPGGEGPFCVQQAGVTGAVTGYLFGVLGVAQNETVLLVVPPAFAYGYDPSNELSHGDLYWTTTVNSFGGAC